MKAEAPRTRRRPALRTLLPSGDGNVQIAEPAAEPAGLPPHTEALLTETLFELAPDAILAVDAQGLVVRVNAQAERIFGYARDELVGQPVGVLVPECPPPAQQRQCREMEPGGGLTGRRRDGSEFAVTVALAPLGAAGVIAIVRDTTEERAAEHALREACNDLQIQIVQRTHELSEASASLRDEHQKLIRADRLSSLGVLAAGIAHEIKNPLAGVTGLVQALRAHTVAAQRIDEYLATILDGLARMHDVLQTTLDFAKVRAPALSCFPAAEMLESCRRLLAPVLRDRDVELVLRGLDSLVLFADRGLVMQAVVNVVMNAVSAAPAHTAVTAAGLVTAERCGIRVSDRGPGIEPGDLARVCEPFFTTRSPGEGTGLGLSITCDILRAHGGDLVVESAVGCGTDVTLWLPLAPAGDVVPAT
jgi:two-component system sensor kinase FixL